MDVFVRVALARRATAICLTPVFPCCSHTATTNVVVPAVAATAVRGTLTIAVVVESRACTGAPVTAPHNRSCRWNKTTFISGRKRSTGSCMLVLQPYVKVLYRLTNSIPLNTRTYLTPSPTYTKLHDLHATNKYIRTYFTCLHAYMSADTE